MTHPEQLAHIDHLIERADQELQRTYSLIAEQELVLLALGYARVSENER